MPQERSEQAWFGAVAAAIAPPCCVVDPATDRVLASNAAAAKLFGVEDLYGLRFSALHPTTVPDLVVFAEEIAYRGEAWTRRLVGRRASGDELALEYEGALVDGPEGPRIVLVASDLSERARREQRTEVESVQRGGLLEWRRMARFFDKYENLYNLILSSAGEGIYGVDAEGRTTFVNPAAERMLGWSADDLIGRNMHAIIHHKHADGRPYAARECPIYNAFRNNRTQRVDDEYFWRKDGHPVRVEYTSTPLADGGEVLGAVVLFRDITERMEKDKRLRAALAEVDQLKRQLEMENDYLQQEIRAERRHSEIIGLSDAIHQTLKEIELVAGADASVLITGESGTGKELVAQAIHKDSTRHKRPLVRVNCAAIPRDLFESEFFGHVKGAFTGALRDRVGRFELANGGTLFLDEVGEIPLELQGKLLRVLQDGRFERVGEDRTRETDVRIIAATNRDLTREVAQGAFREDLYFRLNVFPIALKPLRERREDIPPLAQHFLDHACRRLNRPGLTLSRANVASLMGYDWPGNARELENVIERAAILARGEALSFDLPASAAAAPLAEAAPEPEAPVETEAERRSRERLNLELALKAAGGRVSGAGGAAERLGMKPTTLYSRIKRLGIEVRKG